MNNLLYPPRFKFVVQANYDNFFCRPRTVIVKLYGVVKTNNSELAPHKIVIPATGIAAYMCICINVLMYVCTLY